MPVSTARARRLHQGDKVGVITPHPAGIGAIGGQDHPSGVNQETGGGAAGQAGLGVVMS